jgi:hypothetical protein
MRTRLAVAAAAIIATIAGVAAQKGELGPKVEKTYGDGLPRDRDRIVFRDDQYPVWPLTPAQQAYASINGARMKQHVVNLANIALKYRDQGHKWWGRLPGTSADKEGMAYMTKEFESLGLKVEHFPYVLPTDWRPSDFGASYKTADGKTIERQTVFPTSETKATPPEGITAEAVWVGIGAGADFIGRDVKGKAAVIYSTFVPGGRSHRQATGPPFNLNARAVQLWCSRRPEHHGGAGNGLFQPEGGLRDVPQFTLSQDEGFALRDRPTRARRSRCTSS